MVDGADADVWADVAAGWARWWGSFAAPAQDELVRIAGVGPGTRVLDVGCGTGEFVVRLAVAGADAVGADPAAGMVATARAAGAVVVRADAEALPFATASFDVVTAVNALQFADDTTAALREFTRVTVPGGFVAVANWADATHNDIDTVEAAIAEADGDEPAPGGPLRDPGGLEAAMRAAGLDVTASGLVAAPWHADDDEMLVRGILLGEDDDVVAGTREVVLAAAARFRDADGGYLLHNALRWAVARVGS